MDIFALAADERLGLAELLEGLPEEQLAEPSLCAGWRVHDVAAHLVAVLEAGPPEFLRTIVLSGGSFARANRKLTERRAVRSSAVLVQDLRRLARSRFTPPGKGPEAPLTDLLIHGLDIRRPLGIPRTIPDERLLIALDFLAGKPGSAFVPKGRLDGVRLEATDVEWAAGSGPTVRGEAEDLVLAMTGRQEGVERLAGEGLRAFAVPEGGPVGRASK